MKSTVYQRCYTRYEIKLVATLVINNTNFIQCMIRDFCADGLFLQPLKANVIDTLKPQQKKRILFSVNSDEGSSEDFILDATLVHIRKNGIGVIFENNSTAAFEALKKEAKNALGLIATDKRNNRANLSKQKILETELTTHLSGVLPFIIRNFYQRIKGKPAETSAQFKKLKCQANLQEVISNLEANKNSLFESFCHTVLSTSKLILFSSQQSQAKEAESSLALIDKNDFEDWLNLLAIVRSLESVFDTKLDQLQKKIAYLLGVEKNEIINPASPARLCDCFRDSLVVIEDNSLVRGLFYDSFEQTLLEFLPDLYEKFDEILLRQGAPVKMLEADNWVANMPGNGQTVQSENNKEVMDTSSVHSTDYSINNGDKHISSQKTKPVAEYSAQEIGSAMEHIQQKAANGRSLYFKPQILKIELLQTLSSFSTLPKKLSKVDKNNIEVYECLFDILFNQMFLTDKIQTYLEHMYLVFMAQALQDSDFLEKDSHPVRNIINHLFSLEFAVNENKKFKNINISEILDSLVEKITDKSLNDVSIFAEVESQLNEITKSVNLSIDTNIKREIEQYEGEKKLEQARQSVEEEFKRRALADKEIPEIICIMLEAGWHHLLVMAKLEDNNDSFQNYLRILINLNAWVTSLEEASKEQKDAVLEFIESNLKLVCTNTSLLNEIITELNTLLFIQPGVYAMRMVAFENYGTIEKPATVKIGIDEVDLLCVGEWLSFLLDQETVSLKLIWIDEYQNIFVFVDRGGSKKIQLEREQLSDLINRGDASRIESQEMPIMDRAITLMLQTMHKNLVFNATHDPVTHLLTYDRFIIHLKHDLAKFDKIPYLLCNIEIADYKIITNACGLAGEDALSRQLADCLRSHLREKEIIARLNDNTFSVLLKNCASNNAEKIACKIQSILINSPFIWMEKSYTIAVSIGVVPLFTDSSYNLDKVLQEAEAQTHEADLAGRNCIRIYQDTGESLKSQLNVSAVVDQIMRDFAAKQLVLRCQKISALNPGKNNHSVYEIQLGTRDKEGNIIDPDDFFLALECCHRRLEIDHWVVLTVIDWIEDHQHAFEKLGGFSINLSDESMNSKEFLDFLNNTLKDSLLPLHKITFQINDTAAVDNFIFVQQFIRQIKVFNCKFSLVDLGSGCLSHTYLKKLDIDYLKIYAVFVNDIHNNSNDLAIVKSMNKIAHTLGLETIAENVENDDIHALLNKVGVDHALGTGIQKPKLLVELA